MSDSYRNGYLQGLSDAAAAAEYYLRQERRAADMPRMDMGPEINLRSSFAFDQSIRAATFILGTIESLKKYEGGELATHLHKATSSGSQS